MTTDSWIALGGLLVLVVSAIVGFAMKVAQLQESSRNRDRRLDEQSKRLDDESAERKKKDSDLIVELGKLEERCVRRYEKRLKEIQEDHDDE